MNRRLFSLQEIAAEVGDPSRPVDLAAAEVGIMLARFSEIGLPNAPLRPTMARLRSAALEGRSRLLFDKFGRVAAYANWTDGGESSCSVVGDAVVFHGYVFETLAYFKDWAPLEFHYVRTYRSRRVLRAIAKQNLERRHGLPDTQASLGIFNPSMVVMRESVKGILMAGERLSSLVDTLAAGAGGEHSTVGATVVRLSKAMSLDQCRQFESGGFVTWAWMAQDDVLANPVPPHAWCAGPCLRIVDSEIPSASVDECVEFVRRKVEGTRSPGNSLVYVDVRGSTVAVPTNSLRLAWS